MAKCNQLWNKTAFAKVPHLYGTENTQKDQTFALVKILSILSDHRHYVIEYDPEEGRAFVLTTNGDVCELGYISIPELQELNDNFRLHGFRCPPFEREIYGTPTDGYNIAKVQDSHTRQFNPEAWKANNAEVISV